jgi:hypothetical protein
VPCVLQIRSRTVTPETADRTAAASEAILSRVRFSF